MAVLFSLYLTDILLPSAVFNSSTVLEKYLEGTNPSLIQFKSAPESIRAIVWNTFFMYHDGYFGVPFVGYYPIN